MDRINTERLILRLPSEDDAADMARALSDWEVCCWLSRVPYPYQEVDAADFIKVCRIDRLNKEACRFVIEHENRLTGFIGLEKKADSCFQLGYWVAREKWGKGIASEAVLSIIKFASKELAATRVVASCNQSNKRSENVLRKANFVRKGLGQQFSVSLDKYVTVLEFVLDLGD